MMNEIYRKGPIVCSISTPRDFTYDYRGGIWANEPTKFEEIDHNVEVAPQQHPEHLCHRTMTYSWQKQHHDSIGHICKWRCITVVRGLLNIIGM